jgi:hypothetical protein
MSRTDWIDDLHKHVLGPGMDLSIRMAVHVVILLVVGIVLYAVLFRTVGSWMPRGIVSLFCLVVLYLLAASWFGFWPFG